MKSFSHINAHTIDEAVQLLAQNKGRAKLNAGGTDLLGVLKDRILSVNPELIINIKTIPGLNTLEEDDKELRIGALTSLVDIIKSPLIEKNFLIIKEAALSVASPQIRNIGTIGGNLCQDTRCWYYRYPDSVGGMIKCFRKGGKSCPAVAGENRYHAIMRAKKCFAVCPSDTAVALTALGATLSISGKKGNRIIPVEEFFTNFGNVLSPDELVTTIHIPKPKPFTKQSYIKFTLRQPIDFAVVSTSTLLTLENGYCKEARIVLGAVAPAPVRAIEAEEFLIDKEINEEVAREVANLALAQAKPLSKNSYKAEIARTLIRRTLLASSQ